MSSTKAPNTTQPKIARLAIDLIVEDPDLDTRFMDRRDTDDELITEYRERMGAGDTFPPLQVVHDVAASIYWLVDGGFRLAAAREAGFESIACEIIKGDKRAALLASVAANATHGHQRSNDDKRLAATKMLLDPEWSQWSNDEIARRCRLSHTFIANVRREEEEERERERQSITSNVAGDQSSAAEGEYQYSGRRTYINRWGGTSTMHTPSRAERDPPKQRGHLKLVTDDDAQIEGDPDDPALVLNLISEVRRMLDQMTPNDRRRTYLMLQDEIARRTTGDTRP